MMSGRWLRIAPDDSSTPLQTMSYCQARMSSGSMRLQRFHLALRHREGVVAEVDLLRRPRHIRTSGSRRSSRSGTRPSRSGRAARRRGCAPRRRAWRPRASLPAAKKMPSSGPRPICVGELVHAFGAVVLGDRAAPFAALAGGVAEARQSPRRAPSRSSRRRICGSCRRCPAPATARTTMPLSTIPANRPKPEPTKCSPTSWTISGLRRSGLSLPYLSIASR